MNAATILQDYCSTHLFHFIAHEPSPKKHGLSYSRAAAVETSLKI